MYSIFQNIWFAPQRIARIHIMRSIYLLFLFIAAALLKASPTFAQSGSSIRGKVVDHTEKTLPYMTVSLHNAENVTETVVTVTDSTGTFMFKNIVSGKYYISIKSLAHQDHIGNRFNITPPGTNHDMGVIQLVGKSNVMDEVIIEKKKPLIEQQIDKMIVNVENSALSDGSSSLELLNKIPGLSVSSDGKVSLKGKSDASVMINGKLTYLSADQLANLLRSTSSLDVTKIEVMTNPSSKYEAAGESGIINIVLKKGLKQGFNGTLNLNGGAGRGTQLGGSINLNYRTSNTNFFAIYNQYYQNLENRMELTRYLLDNTSGKPEFISKQTNLEKPKLRSNNFRIGADFILSPKNSIGFLINGGFGKFPKYEPTQNDFSNAATQKLLWRANTVTEGRERWEDMLYNINYVHKFDENGHQLTIDLDHVYHYSKMDQSLLTTYTNEAQEQIRPLSGRIGDIPSRNKVYVGKLDYTLPFENGLKFEAGYKGSLVKTENDLRYDTLQQDQYVPDLKTSNHFIYHESIQAAYVNVNKEWGKFNTQIGLRGEYTDTKGEQLTTNETFTKNYFNLFPSVFLTYSINDQHKMQANYSRRVKRPSFWDMNPFRVYTDPFSYYEGNSKLNPSFANSFELGYTLLRKYILTANYSHSEDVVNEIVGRDPSEPNTVFERPANLGTFTNMGVSLTVPLQLTKWWTATYFGNFYRNKYELPMGESLSIRAGNTLAFNGQNTFSLPHNWRFELGGNYISGMTVGVHELKSYGVVYTGIQKNFLQNKAMLKLVINDIFMTNQRRYETNYTDIRTFGKINRDSRSALLTFTYRFGGDFSSGKDRSTGSEDIKNRL
ncbi:TonB-dependent receptor domain-containing protein [Sphingobacterium spiritivorum]|uniref:TonB-dependent receptor domain-containing protein n=1 Tax=Sphingobacterium spiritivorum TaxID=258 RepID=UPI003DA27EA1